MAKAKANLAPMVRGTEAKRPHVIAAAQDGDDEGSKLYSAVMQDRSGARCVTAQQLQDSQKVDRLALLLAAAAPLAASTYRRAVADELQALASGLTLVDMNPDCC